MPVPDWIDEHHAAHDRLMAARREGRDSGAELADVRALEERDGYLFIHLLRCGIIADPSLIGKWLTGPCVVGPWKLPNGVADTLSRASLDEARAAREAVGHVFSRVAGLEARIRELEARIDELTVGVGEVKVTGRAEPQTRHLEPERGLIS